MIGEVGHGISCHCASLQMAQQPPGVSVRGACPMSLRTARGGEAISCASENNASAETTSGNGRVRAASASVLAEDCFVDRLPTSDGTPSQ